MSDSTAVLELDATALDSEPQEAIKLPESDAELEVTETEGASEEATENEEAQPLTKADLEAAVKAAEAKANESWRQKAENQRKEVEEKAHREAYTQRVTAAQRARQGQASQIVFSLVDWVKQETEKGNTVTPAQLAQPLQNLAIQLDNMAFIEQHEGYSQFVDQLLEEQFPDFRSPRAIENRIRVSRERFDPQDMTRALVEKVTAAVRETETPKIRKELEASFKEAQQKAGKTAALKDSAEQRANNPRPTSANGGAVNRQTFKSIAELDRAIADNPDLLPRGPSSRVAYEQLSKGLPTR